MHDWLESNTVKFKHNEKSKYELFELNSQSDESVQSDESIKQITKKFTIDFTDENIIMFRSIFNSYFHIIYIELVQIDIYLRTIV